MQRAESLVRRAWRLAPAEKRLALESAVMLGLACMAVRCSPASWLTPILRLAPTARRRAAGSDRAVVLRMVDRVAGVHPLRPRCLEQAAAGRWMLARRGHASTLVIGAKNRQFEAHAWLEIDGRVEPPAADVTRYEPIWRSEAS